MRNLSLVKNIVEHRKNINLGQLTLKLNKNKSILQNSQFKVEVEEVK
jgi:hypothetical protein